MAVTDIKVGTDGDVYVAPEGTTLPATADAALDNAFVYLGEISVDGLEMSFDAAAEYVRNWKGTPVRSFTPETTLTFAVTFLETSKYPVDIYFGATTTSILGDKSETKVGQPDNKVWTLALPVVDSKDNSVNRWIVPRAVAGEREAITYANSTAVAYKITFSALYDATEDCFAILQHDTDLTS